MVATNLSKAKANKALIAKISRGYRQFSFKPGNQDHWSAETSTIIYDSSQSFKQLACGVLHELAHALLGHNDYRNDFELLQMESKAWDLAAQIGKKYSVNIDNEYIQNCLDTYRDWLHSRSACPDCGLRSLQQTSTTYKCFNCGCQWQVTTNRLTRPYRKTA